MVIQTGKLIWLLLVITAVFVCAAGCLGNDGADSSESVSNGGSSNDSSSNNASNDSSSNGTSDGSYNNSNNTSPPAPVVPPFNSNLSLVDSVPDGFIFLSTATVKSHGQHIGVTDALLGYQGIYHYGENKTPVFLTYYDTALAGTSKEPAGYIQMMKESHVKQYGGNSKITTVYVNGHEATLLEATTETPPQYGRCILTWELGSMFVTVTGAVDYPALESLATATGY
ncbi:MAG: hypothetical protein FWE78_03710 [Methanimicrococcus sp.]|nr:hypothetical protein [Methanimicrococcus sp.]